MDFGKRDVIQDLYSSRRKDGSLDSKKVMDLYMKRLGEVRKAVSSYCKDDPRWFEVSNYLNGGDKKETIAGTISLLKKLTKKGGKDKYFLGRSGEVEKELSDCIRIVKFYEKEPHRRRYDF